MYSLICTCTCAVYVCRPYLPYLEAIWVHYSWLDDLPPREHPPRDCNGLAGITVCDVFSTLRKRGRERERGREGGREGGREWRARQGERGREAGKEGGRKGEKEKRGRGKGVKREAVRHMDICSHHEYSRCH